MGRRSKARRMRLGWWQCRLLFQRGGCLAGAASARRRISWWRVCAGPSRALVLRGEAGVGKSALLEIWCS